MLRILSCKKKHEKPISNFWSFDESFSIDILNHKDHVEFILFDEVPGVNRGLFNTFKIGDVSIPAS